jgi:hypothetical protein
MTGDTAKRVACGVVILSAWGFGTSVRAQIEIGTWVKQATSTSPAGMTMTVEACCNGGRRLTYRLTNGTLLLVIESAFDGSDAPVMISGKPSGETMAIKRLDSHHAYTVVKMNGKPFGTSKATLSPDGNTITVENEYTVAVPGQPAGKQTEIWVRK